MPRPTPETLEAIDIMLQRKWIVVLIGNVVQGAALYRAWELGRSSCYCDGLSVGNEWHPGTGVSPEEIADRRWNREPHVFVASGKRDAHNFERCAECSYREASYTHRIVPP